jgi:hypothetical protein
LLLLLAAGVGVAGCSAETEPATGVGYSVATLHSRVHCDPGDVGSFRFAYRRAGTTSWQGTSWTTIWCTARLPAAGEADATADLKGLDQGTTYEYALQWKGTDGTVYTVDKDGDSTAGNYDRFTTRAASVALVPSSRRFGDAIGVVTHTAYRGTTHQDFAQLKDALANLRVRNIRDGLWPAEVTEQHAFFRDLATTTDVRGDLGLGILDEDRDGDCGPWSFDSKISMLEGDATERSFVKTIESVNEPDHDAFPGWQDCLRLYQAVLDQHVAGRWPVIGPSFAFGQTSAAQVGDLSSSLDYGNMHDYQGGQPPEFASIDDNLRICAVTAASKPCLATESGYSTALDWPGGPWPVDEPTKAVYTARLVLEHFRRGIGRVFIYQLSDGAPTGQPCAPSTDLEEHFGLYDCHWQPKPAAKALHDLATIMETDGPDNGGGQIRLGLDDAGSDVRQLVLRAPDGTLSVALWRTASIWDRVAKRAIDPGTDRLEVSLSPKPTRVVLYTPISSDQPQETLDRPDRISVVLQGEPVILKVTP